MSSLVRLEPPYGRGACLRDVLPVRRGPRLARTRGMGRWHRPRSGIQFTRASGGARVCFQFWCGQSGQGADILTASEVPVGEPLCGTCEGRAVGAGHPPIGVELRVALLFEPVSSKPPPPVCPATKPRAYVDDRWLRLVHSSVFACPACGVPTRLRAAGGPYDSHVKIEGHQPGPDLLDPCPFHRWDSIVVRADGTAGCSCGHAAWRAS